MPPPTSAMRPLPLLIILMVLDHIAFNGSRVTATLYAIYQGASALTVGILIALYALLPAILSVAAGRWIDRIGVVKPMQIGSIAVGVGTLLPFLFPGMAVLYVSCVIVGLAFLLIAGWLAMSASFRGRKTARSISAMSHLAFPRRRSSRHYFLVSPSTALAIARPSRF